MAESTGPDQNIAEAGPDQNIVEARKGCYQDTEKLCS